MSDRPFIEDFSPDTIGADRFKLSLDESTLTPTAGVGVIINVDYSAADAEGGVVLAARADLQAPTVDGYRRRLLTRAKLEQIVITPSRQASTLVMVRETAHNLAFGAITFDVAGDPIETVPERRGPPPSPERTGRCRAAREHRRLHDPGYPSADPVTGDKIYRARSAEVLALTLESNPAAGVSSVTYELYLRARRECRCKAPSD